MTRQCFVPVSDSLKPISNTVKGSELAAVASFVMRHKRFRSGGRAVCSLRRWPSRRPSVATPTLMAMETRLRRWFSGLHCLHPRRITFTSPRECLLVEEPHPIPCVQANPLAQACPGRPRKTARRGRSSPSGRDRGRSLADERPPCTQEHPAGLQGRLRVIEALFTSPIKPSLNPCRPGYKRTCFSRPTNSHGTDGERLIAGLPVLLPTPAGPALLCTLPCCLTTGTRTHTTAGKPGPEKAREDCVCDI